MNAARSDERTPRRTSALAAAAGAGALWGAMCYSILWEGTPFLVDRRFVESIRGTIVLLPARIALWGVHLAERIAGRTFELADTTWVLAAAVVAAGVVVCVAGVAVVRVAIAAGRWTAGKRVVSGGTRHTSGSRPSGEA